MVVRAAGTHSHTERKLLVIAGLGYSDLRINWDNWAGLLLGLYTGD